MKIGDLVKLKPHCRNSDRLAMVMSIPQVLGFNCVNVMFLDNGEKTPATKSNLEVIK